MTHGPIALTHAGRRVTVEAADVYFTFASGRLSYDCISCNAQCCRGHGYRFRDEPEFTQHVHHYPEVRFFADCDAATASWRIANAAPECFFLADDLRCRIQIDHGFAAKPATCQLFPFNRISLVGKSLVVAPHPGLCPLQVCASDNSSSLSDHEALLRVMASIGLGGRVPIVPTGQLDVARVIAVETRIRDRSEHYVSAPDYLQFACDQSALAKSVLAHDVAALTLSDAQRFVGRLDRAIGAPGSAAPGDSARTIALRLAAITPTLRADALLFDGKAHSLASHAEFLPQMMIALYRLLLLAQAAGMRHITYQTVLNCFRANQPLLWWLSLLDTAVVWRAGTRVDIPSTLSRRLRDPFVAIATSLLPAAQRRAAAILGDIVERNLSVDAVERVQLMKALATFCYGHLVSIESQRLVRVPARSRLRHWVVDALNAQQAKVLTS